MTFMHELTDCRRIVAATLRKAAEWSQGMADESPYGVSGSWLRAAADEVERGSDEMCCALCQETICDSNCPLAEVRRAYAGRPSEDEGA
jgi:hypothetical protein